MFFDIHKILSYNALLNILIGERGCGKTFACSEFCVNQFIKKGNEFIYLRRFKSDLKESVPKFFEALIKEDRFKGHELKTKSNKFYIDNKLCGYALTLTQAQSIKSSNFPKVKYIVFDEFIIEGNAQHYLQNEVENNFLSIVESVARLRDVKIFMLGNAVNLLNPYFIYFNLSLPYNSDIKKFQDGLIVMQYLQNLEYREVKRKTAFGKLIANTNFGKYIIENEFSESMNKDFIEKKSGTSKFTFSFIYCNQIYGVWFDYAIGKIFVSYDYIQNGMQFATTTDDHKPNTMFLSVAKDYNCWKVFIKNFKLGNVYYENTKIKNIVLNIMKSIAMK